MDTAAASPATTGPAPATTERPETLQHRRARGDLIQLLAIAHHSLDAQGVPRAPRRT